MFLLAWGAAGRGADNLLAAPWYVENGVMAVSILTLMALAKLSWDAHYFDGYDPSTPLNVVVLSEEDREGYHRVYFTYEAYPGNAVPSLMALPIGTEGPYPVLVFLHGIGQSKAFLDEIAPHFANEGFILATFDQHMQGERKLKDPTFIEQGLALRRRGALTVNEARRMVDYLDTRPDVDKDRIYLIGASYGAVTGATAAAFEKRFKAVVLTYGGGDLSQLAANEEVIKAVGPLTGYVGRLASFFGAPFDPVRYVDGVSPRPILFQNGNRDRIVVPAAAMALHRAAKEPKEIKWYPSDHLDLDPDYIHLVIRDGLEWIKAQDARLVAERAQK